MQIEIDPGDVGVTLDLWAEKVGETTEQATIRLAVGVARSLMVETRPKQATIADLKKKTAASMGLVVEPVAQVHFNRILSGKARGVAIDGKLYPVRQDRVLKSIQDIWSAIERHRDNRGRTIKLAPRDRYICGRANFNKVVMKRRRLWGVAKGAWYGAGLAAGRKQAGLDRINIKPKPKWIEHHSSKGQSTQMGSRHDTTIILGS